MKKTYWIAASIVGIILLSNLTIISWLFHENYTYSNADGSFKGSEEAGGTAAFQTVKYNFEDFKKKYPNQTDTTLYRTFTIKPWRFWQWSDYIFCYERFKLPYKEQ